VCGYEGDDLLCPVCKEKMESVDKELEKIEKVEKDEDLLSDDAISLEDEAEAEQLENSEEDATTEDI
jgi:predicted RND superfamily exporter protein